ncbi:MAG: hypothetical protein GKS00_20205 [Alphaproteobacteria bacterium]|nr:hypothetical protein [Alphaproteobacteria bacterium]
MQRHIAVHEGQRYTQEFKTVSQKKLWEVASLCGAVTQVQHVRLINLGSPKEVKTLSCLALNGEHGYSLISS